MCDPSTVNPRDTKERLAKEIITRFHSADAADAAAAEFKRVHGGGGKGGLPDEIPERIVPAEMIDEGSVATIDLITHCGFAKSRGDARRLVAQGGIRLNGKALDDPMRTLPIKTGDVLQRGKRQFVRLEIGV